MRSCSEIFLRQLRIICDLENIVLIFDEVYTGWAKTGTLFYFMKYPELIPDILTYAKSFGGGKASISGYTTDERIFRSAYDNLADATLHSTTYYGFGEETATAITAVNEIVDQDYVGRSRFIGEQASKIFTVLKSKHPEKIGEIRGSGALWGIIIKDSFIQSLIKVVSPYVPSDLLKDPRISNKLIVSSIISRLYNSHNILTFYGSNIDTPLIISFPLVATEKELELMEKALDDTFGTWTAKLVLDFIIQKLKTP